MMKVKTWRIVHLLLVACLCLSLVSNGQPNWVASGAAIGDTSIYSYPSGGVSSSAVIVLRHPNNEDSLRLMNISGNPDGLHVYRVDQRPNYDVGIDTSSGGNDRYFGVFVVNGLGTNYRLTYFYNDNPYVLAYAIPNGTEQSLELYLRSTNADNTWATAGANSSLDINADTISKYESVERREYILGGICDQSSGIRTWTGNAGNSNWYAVNNWSCGGYPDIFTDAVIPAGLPNYPDLIVIGNFPYNVNDLTIQGGAKITVRNGATLRISGDLTNNGDDVLGEGKVKFIAPTQSITGINHFGNFEVGNGTQVTLNDMTYIDGTLRLQNGAIVTNGNLVLYSDSNGTGMIHPGGSGSISGTVTMQRYVSGSTGYRHFTAPFSGATIADFDDDVLLQGLGGNQYNPVNPPNPFPNIWEYDETQTDPDSMKGWVSPIALTSSLTPM